ncbi:MAG: hypothetical protein KHX03_03310 [Clostridium sp.]|nr:hypothetical protein [Clostridium sp.]
MNKSECYKKKIYTFFSAGDEMIPYSGLCLKTWKKNLPKDYEIEIINNSKIFSYISRNLLPGPIEAVCSSPLFFDYLALNVLYNNGGIFLRPHIVMTEKFKPCELLIESSDLVFYYNMDLYNCCPGFYMAKRGSLLLKNMLDRFFTASDMCLSKIFFHSLRDVKYGRFLGIDAENTGFLMEKSLFGVYNEYIHKKYYFTDICSWDEFVKTSKGLTLLNCLWLPEKYKKMGEFEFLNQNILLSKIFKKILYV